MHNISTNDHRYRSLESLYFLLNISMTNLMPSDNRNDVLIDFQQAVTFGCCSFNIRTQSQSSWRLAYKGLNKGVLQIVFPNIYFHCVCVVVYSIREVHWNISVCCHLVFGTMKTSIILYTVIIYQTFAFEKYTREHRCVNMNTLAVLTTHYLCNEYHSEVIYMLLYLLFKMPYFMYIICVYYHSYFMLT